MRLDTVTLRHKKKGTIIKVNQWDYQNDLGAYRFRGYEYVTERNYGEDREEIVGADGETVTITQREAQAANAEVSRQAKEKAQKKVDTVERRKRTRARKRKVAEDKEPK